MLHGKSGQADVEVGKRGIMADIEMKAGYEGKKVSRAQLMADDDSEEGKSDDMEEDDEEGFEEEDVSAMSASSSESVAMDTGRLNKKRVNVEDSSEDEDKKRGKKLLKLAEDKDDASDAELDAALDRVIENKTEESKIHQTKKVSDIERAEAV